MGEGFGLAMRGTKESVNRTINGPAPKITAPKSPPAPPDPTDELIAELGKRMRRRYTGTVSEGLPSLAPLGGPPTKLGR